MIILRNKSFGAYSDQVAREKERRNIALAGTGALAATSIGKYKWDTRGLKNIDLKVDQRIHEGNQKILKSGADMRRAVKLDSDLKNVEATKKLEQGLDNVKGWFKNKKKAKLADNYKAEINEVAAKQKEALSNITKKVTSDKEMLRKTQEQVGKRAKLMIKNKAQKNLLRNVGLGSALVGGAIIASGRKK